MARDRGRGRGALVCAAAVVYLGALASCAWALPDNRGYELVSPTAKHGTGVVSDSQRTRAATDGNALQFLSLGAFADAMGTGVATEYAAERTAAPRTSGWATHAITPLQSSVTLDGLAGGGQEPMYLGEFSPDLSSGVFFAQSPLTDDAGTANVPNLYRRSDLLTPGRGTYALITGCPLCDATGTPLPPPTDSTSAAAMSPVLAWTSPSVSRVAFESQLRLTADTPVAVQRVELYEWDAGSVTLAGRVPRGGGSFCDDTNGPACVASPLSIAGQGATNLTRTPHVVSDGTDGHNRVFFTFPTDNGVTPNPGGFAGQLYMRLDGAQTVKLNVSERGAPDAFAPATFLDASADGEQAFFMTAQALTDDAPVNGDAKIYMYDASIPAATSGHLTLLNADHEPGDTTITGGDGIVGLSADGRYVYFVTSGQIVAGQPLLGPTTPGLYLWHDGVVRFVASFANADETEALSSGPAWIFRRRQARISPDGRWLLYRAISGTTRQLFLYSADSGASPVCISCPVSGAPSADATDTARTGVGGTGAGWHENHALADDGSRVFFSTAQALVPEDVNGRADVYEYDVASGSVHLISSGTSPADSWFMDASANGSDVFFTTSQQLVGWDTDQEYDVYDARVNGGFPDPPPSAPPCAGVSCRGAREARPLVQPLASAVFSGAGNAGGTLKPRARPCRRGFVRKRVRGRVRCVKQKAKRHARGRRVRSGQRRAS